ncbi:MAG: tRNA pseudouridine(38-40) synthase TruA [Myxococcales bacterium]|nr:tRNA pseudouridine(38-40) synthase TruA [Myxococcales bacterium]
MRYGVRLTVAYDGTAFHGFQEQAGLRCVQSELAKVAGQIAQHPVMVWGASRTDAGVHAEGQVVAFGTNRELSPRRWAQALNRYLPPDLAVRHVSPCPTDYQPRFDATHKLYRYLFHLGTTRDPLLRHRAWHLGKHIPRVYPERDRLDDARHDLDLDAMRHTVRAFVGTHDFSAFRAASDTRSDTVRTMLRARIVENFMGQEELLAFEVEGTAFMKNMVRIMAGTLIAAGRRRLTQEQVRALLVPGGDRRLAGETAPPHGLTLLRVRLGRLE